MIILIIILKCLFIHFGNSILALPKVLYFISSNNNIYYILYILNILDFSLYISKKELFIYITFI